MFAVFAVRVVFPMSTSKQLSRSNLVNLNKALMWRCGGTPCCSSFRIPKQPYIWVIVFLSKAKLAKSQCLRNGPDPSTHRNVEIVILCPKGHKVHCSFRVENESWICFKTFFKKISLVPSVFFRSSPKKDPETQIQLQLRHIFQLYLRLWHHRGTDNASSKHNQVAADDENRCALPVPSHPCWEIMLNSSLVCRVNVVGFRFVGVNVWSQRGFGRDLLHFSIFWRFQTDAHVSNQAAFTKKK